MYRHQIRVQRPHICATHRIRPIVHHPRVQLPVRSRGSARPSAQRRMGVPANLFAAARAILRHRRLCIGSDASRARIGGRIDDWRSVAGRPVAVSTSENVPLQWRMERRVPFVFAALDTGWDWMQHVPRHLGVNLVICFSSHDQTRYPCQSMAVCFACCAHRSPMPA